MKRIVAIITVLAMLFALAACGSKTEPASSAGSTDSPNSTSEAQQGSSTAAAEPQSGPAQETEGEGGLEPSAEDGFFHVSSVGDLLEAIRPGAGIIIEPGYYDLTDFLKDYTDKAAMEAWNAGHPYVQLSEVFDGLEVTIRDVPYL